MNEYEELRFALSVLPDTVKVSVLGRTLLGRDIPMITLGRGERAVLFVAGVHGTDALTSRILLAFITEYLDCLARRSTQYSYPMEQLFRERCVFIVPMLNPDGICYVSEGVGEENPLAARVIAMNGGADFSNWRANARGVELSRNFSIGFSVGKERERKEGIIGGAPRGFGGEYPESEPENAALCRFMREQRERLQGVLELRLGTDGIRCGCEDHLTAKCVATGRVLARYTGLHFSREPRVACGSLNDWCVHAQSRPAYEISCDTSKLTAGTDPCTLLFAQLRRALFCFPYML